MAQSGYWHLCRSWLLYTGHYDGGPPASWHEIRMKDGNYTKLITLVRHLADLERTTTAGRINILGMLLSVILAISLALAPIFETLVRLLHPKADVGAPIFELFVYFLAFVLICAVVIGYLEGPNSGAKGADTDIKGRKSPKEDSKDRSRSKK